MTNREIDNERDKTKVKEREKYEKCKNIQHKFVLDFKGLGRNEKVSAPIRLNINKKEKI